MNPLFEAAQEVFHVLNEIKIPACLIGGLAVQRWGQPRQTLDVDLTMVVQLETEEQLIDKLLSVFRARISTAKEFALARRVLLLAASNGVGLDLALLRRTGARPGQCRAGSHQESKDPRLQLHPLLAEGTRPRH